MLTIKPTKAYIDARLEATVTYTLKETTQIKIKLIQIGKWNNGC